MITRTLTRVKTEGIQHLVWEPVEGGGVEVMVLDVDQARSRPGLHRLHHSQALALFILALL